MELIQEYWWLIAAAVVVLALLVLLGRPRQRVKLSDDSAPVRPHMAAPARPAEGRGLASEAAAAAGDVAGDILRAPVHAKLGEAAGCDDLNLLKGVGPKFADALANLGFTRFEQIAALSSNEVERLDAQLGAFRGRITRDRIVEQAEYLARNDIDGFEQRFGKI